MISRDELVGMFNRAFQAVVLDKDETTYIEHQQPTERLPKHDAFQKN
jgi:hypothetical protein